MLPDVSIFAFTLGLFLDHLCIQFSGYVAAASLQLDQSAFALPVISAYQILIFQGSLLLLIRYSTDKL
jgi:hypothetical protein